MFLSQVTSRGTFSFVDFLYVKGLGLFLPPDDTFLVDRVTGKGLGLAWMVEGIFDGRGGLLGADVGSDVL